MMIVMKQDATEEQIQAVIARIEAVGARAHRSPGEEVTVIGAIGDREHVQRLELEGAPGVDKVMPILKPYKLASSQIRHGEPSVLEIGGRKIGGDNFALIAGPCTVESRDQVMTTADIVKGAGATLYRGGAFKPRTSPYAFHGMGEEGLKNLAEARDKTGLAIVTEVMRNKQIPSCVEYADVLQIGARNMQNFNLLSKVGETTKPVLLKRGMSATLEEFLLAAEYIMARGNTNVILCERGIRTFEDYVRNTLPLAIVPELHRRSHLPVVVDPSHGTGKSHLVAPMCKASVAAGCDGLIVETHADPEHAMTDGAQSLTPKAFKAMMEQVKRVALAVDREI